MKIKRGIKLIVMIKSAICFFIFYFIIMVFLTIFLAEVSKNNVQTKCDFALSNMSDRLQEIIEFKNSDYYENENILNQNISMMNFTQTLSREKVYSYAKLVNENGEVICNTGNILYVGMDDGKSSSKLIILDKLMTKKQISQLYLFMGNGKSYKSTIIGILKGCEIIPKIITIYKDNDNKKIEFKFTNSHLNNSEFKTMNLSLSGFFENYGGNKVINKQNEKNYAKVQINVENDIRKYLKPILQSLKNNASASYV